MYSVPGYVCGQTQAEQGPGPNVLELMVPVRGGK